MTILLTIVPNAEQARIIKSQWQAYFLQIFPFYFSDLPQTHPSDRQCFERCWEGSPMSYESFMASAYPGLAIPADVELEVPPLPDIVEVNT